MGKFYLVLATIVAVVSWLTMQHQTQPIPALPSVITTAPVVDELVAVGINLPPNKPITLRDITTGKYPIVVFEIAPNEYALDMPHRIGHLTRFDVQHTGIINASNPIYARLALGYISADGKTIKFVSFQNVGIRAIILDTTHAEIEEKMGLPPGGWELRNTYVMSDNSRWISYHIPVPSTALQNLKPSNPNQYIVPLLPSQPASR